MTQGVRRIISGGQTGADRAALDAALELGIAHGGWAPRGRWAEDGTIAARYQLRESDSPQPAARTAMNVCDSDATLILSHGPLSGGSALTLAIATRERKPALHVDLDQTHVDEAATTVRAWLASVHPAVLNVAGPRASSDARIYDGVRAVLRAALARVDTG